jgi:predicted O-linked N-acetylglucosamine transferase (SPINDLY family)
MSSIEFQSAVNHHLAGHLAEAEEAYRRVLAKSPSHIDAMHGLGVIALQMGRPREAVELIGCAVAARPGVMSFLSNLGMAHQALGQHVEAEAAFRQAIEMGPNVAGPFFNLANLLKEKKQLTAAVDTYLRVLVLQADNPAAHNNLGNCYHALGRFDEAHQSLLQAIQLRPDYAEAYLNLGSVLTALGRPAEAEATCREALRRQPNLPEAYVNLGLSLFAQDRFEEAAEAYRQAAVRAPGLATAHENLGLALLQLERLSDAVTSYRRAIDAAPNRADAWARLANGLMTQRQTVEAEECFRRALELERDNPSLWSEWLHWQLYRSDVTLTSIADRHAEWNRRFGSSCGKESTSHAHANSIGLRHTPRVIKSPDKKLRLGLVSADFGRHPVGRFSIRTVEALASLNVEIFCYSTCRRGGEINDRFRRCAVEMREVGHLTDDDAAGLIAADQVDVLIDLSGHTAGNRLGVFARRPARVQATWIGSEGTTGLAAMDYFICDERVVPRSADRFYCERVIRLPTSYVAWDPPVESHVVAPSSGALGQPVTFASFNNPAKYHAGLAELWSQILDRVPGSRLVLQSRHLTDQALRRNLIDLFAASGTDPHRLDLRGWQTYPQLLDTYGEVDIALDPFPFGGGATTCDALWMGVPVVTWPGETFSSRHSCSYLTTIGMTELIADSANEYVEIAVGLANDHERLRTLRTTLRQQMADSPLCDGQNCARELVAALHAICFDEVGFDHPLPQS